MKEEQRKAYKELDELLTSGEFEAAIEKMRSWDTLGKASQAPNLGRIWINQFLSSVPTIYPPPLQTPKL